MTQAEAQQKIAKAIEVFFKSNGTIRPHLLLTGESGSGKTFLAQHESNKHRMPFIEVNAAQLTNEGISGNSLSKALVPLKSVGNQLNIIFMDEVDKLFVNGEDVLVGRETKIGVQNELLKLLEDRFASVIGDYGKYDQIQVDNTLFIFAGAFNGEQNITYDRLRDFGLRNEFLGRLGLLVHVPKPSLSEIEAVLRNHATLKTYCTMFQQDEKKVGDYIMAIIEKYHPTNRIGMRIITALAHMYFMNSGKITTEMLESVLLAKDNVKIDFNKGIEAPPQGSVGRVSFEQ